MHLAILLHTTPLTVGDIRYNGALWLVCLEIIRVEKEEK